MVLGLDISGTDYKSSNVLAITASIDPDFC